MIFKKYLKEKQAFIFELDDVIFPEKDYLLQVYYLFAQFIEYGEQLSGTAIVEYMQQTYFAEGDDDIFAKVAKQFNIPEKYQVNYNMLLHSVRLPLKLLIYDEVLSFLQEIVLERKQLFLFVDGDPAMQLNKIRQTEWNGLEKYLTVYFAREFESVSGGLELIIEKYKLKKEDTLIIGKSDFIEKCALDGQIDYLKADKLFIV